MTIALESPLPRLKWTRDRYHAAYRAGLLPDSIELIDGDIITVPNPDPIHEGTIRKLIKLLSQAIAAHAADIQAEKNIPIALGATDEPAADVALVRIDPDEYTQDHPTVDDVYLVIEVANSHPERDRKQKLPQYAKGRVLDYWVVDLQQQELLVCREPIGDDYTQKTVVKDGTIKLVRLPDVVINVAELNRRIFG